MVRGFTRTVALLAASFLEVSVTLRLIVSDFLCSFSLLARSSGVSLLLLTFIGFRPRVNLEKLSWLGVSSVAGSSELLVSFGAEGLFSGVVDCFFLSSGLAIAGDDVFFVAAFEGGGGAFLTGEGLDLGEDLGGDDDVPTLLSL